MAKARIHVVMGVSACGKSTVGRLLAQARAATYLDGDDFHPRENVERMAAGQALTDADRQGWLLVLSDAWPGPAPMAKTWCCRARR
jgi:carbohydrate kinase (thermoresistant glucokinase family)